MQTKLLLYPKYMAYETILSGVRFTQLAYTSTDYHDVKHNCHNVVLDDICQTEDKK